MANQTHTKIQDVLLGGNSLATRGSGLLGQMLGRGGAGDLVSNPVAKAALPGIAALAAKKVLSRR